MNALEALKAAHEANGNLAARPLSWRGSGHGIFWSESNEKSPFPWREGWRVVGKPTPKYAHRKNRKLYLAKLPEPEELAEEWEVVEFWVMRKEMGFIDHDGSGEYLVLPESQAARQRGE